MKVEPTPTSPKAKLQDKKNELAALYREESATIQRPARKSMHWWTLIFAILFGFFAGILGDIAFETYVGLYELQPTSPILTQRPDTIANLRQNLEQANRTVLGLYPRHDTADGGLVAGTYSDTDLFGAAVLVSSDGWAVTTALQAHQVNDYVAVTHEKKVLALKNAFEDPATGATFFHIDGGGYPIALFSEPPDAVSFAPYYVAAPTTHSAVVRVRNVAIEYVSSLAGGALESSDRLDRRIVLADELPAQYAGSPLLDEKGRVVALLTLHEGSTSFALSVGAIRQVLGDALRNQKVSRPFLGVRYVDVSRVPGVPEAVTGGRTKGALLAGTQDQPAVVASSPAETAGLREGDIITAVDERPIDITGWLSELLQDYEPGETITVQYVREGVVADTIVTIRELEAI